MSKANKLPGKFRKQAIELIEAFAGITVDESVDDIGLALALILISKEDTRKEDFTKLEKKQSKQKAPVTLQVKKYVNKPENNTEYIEYENKIDYYCPATHYLDHAVDSWSYLHELKGNLYITENLREYAESRYPDLENVVYVKHLNDLKSKLAKSNRYLLVFSYYYCQRLHTTTKCILVEHGAGLVYNSDDPHWGRHYKPGEIAHFLVTNSLLQKKIEKNNPFVPTTIVGCPKLDKYARKVPKMSKKPVFAISSHWGGTLPEVQSGFDYFKDSIIELSKHYKVLGHWHPNLEKQLKPFYIENNIEPVADFSEVLDRADIYICDNSSTIWEFARIGKPVVLLNPPEYRKDFEHEYNPRFWSYADVGVNIDSNEEFMSQIKKAIKDYKYQQKRRLDASNVVFPNYGYSRNMYCQAIDEVLKTPIDRKKFIEESKLKKAENWRRKSRGRKIKRISRSARFRKKK